MTGIWETLIAAAFIGLLLFGLHRAGRLAPLVSVFRRFRHSRPRSPISILAGETDTLPHGNQRLAAGEYGTPPNTVGAIIFPARTEPVTPYEDFNQKLFILDAVSTFPRWPEVIANDHPTEITGSLDWVRSELHVRLRPLYPVILDTFGWWAAASAKLELDPTAQDPIISAYLAMPAERRPVVISRRWKDEYKGTEKLELFRYGFEDYAFDPKFLAGYPSDLLLQLMLPFTGSVDEWWLFSPARLRKLVLDQHAASEAMTRAVTSAMHKNRFAALWGLPDAPAKAGGAERAE